MSVVWPGAVWNVAAGDFDDVALEAGAGFGGCEPGDDGALTDGDGA